MDWQSDYYGDKGCCLTCDPEWKENHLLDWDWEEYDDYPEKKGTCLCRACMCRQCFWYEPNDDDWDSGGKCTYPRRKNEIKPTALGQAILDCGIEFAPQLLICSRNCNRYGYCRLYHSLPWKDR